MRLIALILFAGLSVTIAFGQAVPNDGATKEPTPIYAPDPGDPPPFSPQIHPLLIVAGVFASSAAVLFGLSAHVQGKISRKRLILIAGTVLLTTWTVLGITLAYAPPSEEYKRWEEAHRKWENKEIVGELYEDE